MILQLFAVRKLSWNLYTAIIIKLLLVDKQKASNLSLPAKAPELGDYGD